MNKVCFIALTAALAAAGCATTGTTAQSTTAASQPITLDQAFEKSAQARQQIETVKQQYQQDKTTAEVATGKKTAAGFCQRLVCNY